MYKGFNLTFGDGSYYASNLLKNYGAQANTYRLRKASARRSGFAPVSPDTVTPLV